MTVDNDKALLTKVSTGLIIAEVSSMQKVFINLLDSLHIFDMIIIGVKHNYYQSCYAQKYNFPYF